MKDRNELHKFDILKKLFFARKKLLTPIFGKGVLSYFLWLSIFRFLANLSVDFHQNWAIGPTFHGNQFGPVTGPLARLKMSDFGSITSYGSVQVSAAQICKNFENRYVRTRDMGKKLTENGHFWALFLPILVRFCSVIRLIWGFYEWEIHL